MSFQIHSVNELTHLPSLNALRFKGNPLFQGKMYIKQICFYCSRIKYRIQFDSIGLFFQRKLRSKVVKNCLLAFPHSLHLMEAR